MKFADWVIIILIFLFCGFNSTTGLQAQDKINTKLTPDQKQILQIYTTQYLADKDQKLYGQSVKEQNLLHVLDPPLTPENFKQSRPFYLLHHGITKVDTLFSAKELKIWSAQIAAYHQIQWTPKDFSTKVSFIHPKDIPDYRKRMAMPPPGHTSFMIHYITPPFIYNGKTALMYAKTTRGVTTKRIRYLYFAKKNSQWRLVDSGSLAISY